MFPLTAYIEAALELARYDKLGDGTFAGEIPKLPGVVAFGRTLCCRHAEDLVFFKTVSIAACNCGMVCGPSALSALALKEKTGSAVARKTIRKIRLIGPDTQ